jgi:hypothetical protein
MEGTGLNDDAVTWLHQLAARGITTQLVKGRLRHFPASAYKLLTDDELIFLRHHRDDIKAALRAGVSVTAAPTTPERASPTAAAAPEQCRWCRRAPCIGSDHPEFVTLHPHEAHNHVDELATQEMLGQLGKALPDWWWQ